MTGRKPKPTWLKQLAGNPGKRPLNESEPKPPAMIPDCPPQLCDEARAEWGRITPLLYAMGVLAEVDRAAVAAYCEYWAEWADAREKIRATGKIIKAGKNGYPIANPYVAIANTAADLMRKFIVEFGMTASSRSRIHAGPSSERGTNPFAEIAAETFAGEAASDRPN